MNHIKPKHTIITAHPFDPLGTKVGGIETHVRQTLRYKPESVRMIMIGIDDSGQLPLGEITKKSISGIEYDFFPVMHGSNETANHVAKKLSDSSTLNFFLGLFKYARKIKALTTGLSYSFEIQRYEFAWFLKLMRLKYVLITHGDADPNQPLDTLLSKYWFLHQFNERHAVKGAQFIYSVSSEQTKRLKKDFPKRADDIDYMTVSVDDRLFKATPFQSLDGPLKIAFVGRLDTFKRPGMMFRVIKSLSDKLNGQIEFHYIGKSDPEKFTEFQEIKDKTVLHGFRNSEQISELWKSFHMGIVTSTFEGWPVYVMEAICSGRPVVSVNLPQLIPVFEDEIAGKVFDRNNDSDELVSEMSDKFIEYWKGIKNGSVDPIEVNSRINCFKASTQMKEIFKCHVSGI